MRALVPAAGVALAVSLLPAASPAQPRITAPVTDLADAIPAEQEQQLTQKLANHRAASGVAVAVLVVPSTAPLALEDYSMRVATAWRQDLLGATSAVLYVLAVRDHRHRLEVNNVARARLTDERSRAALDAARPALRANDWGDAVRVVMDGVLTALAAPAAPSPTVVEPPSPDPAPAPSTPPPRFAAPVAHAPEPTGGEKAFFGFVCVATVLLIVGIIGAVIVSLVRRVNRAVRSLSGTTYGHSGSSHFAGADADAHAHNASWFASGHDASSSSWSSSDSSSSFSSSDSSSSSGGDFSGGGASSDW